MPVLPETNMVYEADAATGYRLAPHEHGRFGNGTRGWTNAQGFRNRELGPKAVATFRIVVVGDSFTMGSSVEQYETYPALLERELAARVARPVEVVNTGVGGWDPFQYAQFFAQRGRELEADLVLVGFFVGNDTYSPKLSVAMLETAVGGRRIPRAAASRPGVWLRVKLLEWSHLARALHPTLPLEGQRRDCADFSAAYLALQRGALSNYLPRSPRRDAAAAANVAQVARLRDAAGGVPVVVALLPDETQVNPALRRALASPSELAHYDFTMPQSLLHELFAGARLPVVDLLPDFAAAGGCQYNDTTHWNPSGNALAARALAERLRPWIPDVPPR
jgi:hypothetical protein